MVLRTRPHEHLAMQPILIRFLDPLFYERHTDGSTRCDFVVFPSEQRTGWLQPGVYGVVHVDADVRYYRGPRAHPIGLVELSDVHEEFLGYMRYEKWIELKNNERFTHASLLELMAEVAR